MPYEVDFSLWIHVRGSAEIDFKPEDPEDLTDFIFSDECTCEVDSVTTDPSFCGKGYMEVTAIDEDDENDDEDEEDPDE